MPGCSAAGSALGLGPRCRRFDSCHSDHDMYQILIQRKSPVILGFFFDIIFCDRAIHIDTFCPLIYRRLEIHHFSLLIIRIYLYITSLCLLSYNMLKLLFRIMEGRILVAEHHLYYKTLSLFYGRSPVEQVKNKGLRLYEFFRLYRPSLRCYILIKQLMINFEN